MIILTCDTVLTRTRNGERVFKASALYLNLSLIQVAAKDLLVNTFLTNTLRILYLFYSNFDCLEEYVLTLPFPVVMCTSSTVSGAGYVLLKQR